MYLLYISFIILYSVTNTLSHLNWKNITWSTLLEILMLQNIIMKRYARLGSIRRIASFVTSITVQVVIEVWPQWKGHLLFSLACSHSDFDGPYHVTSRAWPQPHKKTRASRSTCTPRKHYCEMTDNTNAHVASCTV